MIDNLLQTDFQRIILPKMATAEIFQRWRHHHIYDKLKLVIISWDRHYISGYIKQGLLNETKGLQFRAAMRITN